MLRLAAPCYQPAMTLLKWLIDTMMLPGDVKAMSQRIDKGM